MVFSLRSASFVLLASAAFSAQAITLNFAPLHGEEFAGYTEFDSTLNVTGFKLDTDQHFARWTSGTSYGSNSTGTNAIFSEYREDSIRLSKPDNSAFNFLTIDIANLFTQADCPFRNALDANSTISTITFSATLLGGGTATRTYTTTHDNLFHSVNLNLYGVTSVTWIQEGAAFHQFNNLFVQPYSGVPEPSAMAALGLGAAVLVRRRRR